MEKNHIISISIFIVATILYWMAASKGWNKYFDARWNKRTLTDWRFYAFIFIVILVFTPFSIWFDMWLGIGFWKGLLQCICALMYMKLIDLLTRKLKKI